MIHFIVHGSLGDLRSRHSGGTGYTDGLAQNLGVRGWFVLFFRGKGGCRLFRAIDIGRRNNKVEGYVYGYTHGSMDRFAFKIIANIFKRVDSAC